MLSLAFVAFALCIGGAIDISRRMTVKSETMAYGRVWTGAILSEYDRHLIEDYRILAYRGLDCEITGKLKRYSDYSLEGGLGADISGIDSSLYGMELSDPENFRQALINSELSSSVSALIGGNMRRKRLSDEDTRFGKRIIRNRAVINSLPSKGDSSSINAESMGEALKGKKGISDILGSAGDGAIELAYMYQYFGSHNESVGDRKTLLRNEWEYILCGKLDDDANYKSVMRKLFAIRNALNLAYLYKDTGKRELLITAAELITPGPAAALTQVVLAEAWAALEAKEDLDALEEGKRIPIMKNDATWRTDIKNVLGSDEVAGKLDDEAMKNLGENYDEIAGSDAGKGGSGSIKDGLTYEEYLLAMITMVSSNTRTLRMMDLVSINMRYRYYEDFNMDEYHIGTRFSIMANGRQYDFAEKYE